MASCCARVPVAETPSSLAFGDADQESIFVTARSRPVSHSIRREGIVQSTVTQESVDSRRYPARPLLGVGAVVFRDNKVLLIERGQPPLEGHWTLPGGLVETGERLESAVRREILEETGLEIRPIDVAAIFERIMPDEEGQTEYHYVIVDYLCECTGGTLKAGSDVANAAWVALDRLHTLPMAPGTPPVIEKARHMAGLQHA